MTRSVNHGPFGLKIYFPERTGVSRPATLGPTVTPMRPAPGCVFFEGPFWVGILEIRDDDRVRVARHVFGEEPSGPELYAFGLSRDHDRLLRRALNGPVAPCPAPWSGAVNPKRAAREAAKERRAPQVSTAAQAVMKTALEQSKSEKRGESRAQRLVEAARRRDLARAKAKARHRGR